VRADAHYKWAKVQRDQWNGEDFLAKKLNGEPEKSGTESWTVTPPQRATEISRENVKTLRGKYQFKLSLEFCRYTPGIYVKKCPGKYLCGIYLGKTFPGMLQIYTGHLLVL